MFLESDIALAPVLNVVKEDYRGYVYDISVSETEAFYGGCAPILLHNTGHGGLSTIHAESIESAVKRLISPPMNIPPSHIPLLDAVALVERVSLPRPVDGKSYGRRIRYIWEVVDYGRYVTIAEWNPATDSFRIDLSNSVVLDKIAARIARTKEEVIAEIERRAALLRRLIENRVIEIRDIAREIYTYYSNPEQILRKYGIKAEVIQVPVSEPASAPMSESMKAPEAEAVEAESPSAWSGEDEEDKVAENILNILREHEGTYPLWRIFVEAPVSKITVFKALKKLRESGKVEVSQSIVRLKES